MTENEAIRELEWAKNRLMQFTHMDNNRMKAFNMAIQALEKVQALEENETYQIYREYLAIGTVEEIQLIFSLCKDLERIVKKYEAIGTIDEFKALKEKAEPKEMDRYYCPICRHYFEDTDAYNYCPVCGQKMKSILE